jgi:5-methylthioadenosine/S-adenosylhomocysteine deaminase
VSYTIQNVLIATESGYESGYETVDVTIANDRITAIGPQLPPQGTLIDGRQKLLLPGFVNAHTHSSEMWQRGLIPPLPLELWLSHLYDFPALEPEQVYLSAVGTAIETLLTGGTTVVDHLVLIPGRERETIAAAVRGYQEVGIRAFVAPLIQDETTNGLPALPTQPLDRTADPSTTAAVLDLMTETVEQWHRPEAGIQIVVAPTGIQLCSDALFRGCVELSDRYNLCRHAHLLESKAQTILAQEKYQGSAVQHLQQLGYLGDRTSLAHCVWLTDADIEILAETRSTVVHNPLSNLRLGSGIAPILKYRQAGVNVAFGCDGSASNDSQDLLEAIKIGSILHNTTDFEYQNWITPRQSVSMAALGGATGVAMSDQMGSLTVGKKADLVMYDLTNLSLLPRTDPIGLLILGRPVQAVENVWVNGKQVVSAGKTVTIDTDALRRTLWEQSEAYSEQVGKPSPTRMAIESHYRAIMGLSPLASSAQPASLFPAKH